MGKSSEDNRTAMLMAAVSAIALSVGMVPAEAADQTPSGQSNQHKDTTLYQKHESSGGASKQIKIDSIAIKHETVQIKGDSSQQKGSNQVKGEAIFIKHQSSQIKGESVQQKGNSLQQKGSTHGLNPQPEPPG